MPSSETLLARALATRLHENSLGVYRADGTPYLPGEHAILVDRPAPTTMPRYTIITPLQTLTEGRADRMYRVQLIHQHPNTTTAREWAESVFTLLDQKPLPILGISWTEEYSRVVFDPDTQNRVTASQNFLFRGRRP